MLRQSDIQLFFRNMLIDGLKTADIDIPIVFENIKGYNLQGSYIVEQMFSTSEVSYNTSYTEYSGLYKLTLFSEYGTGLQVSDLIDIIKEIFPRGTYEINIRNKQSTSESASVCIDNYISSDLIYQRDSDKVQKSVSIEYRVFYTQMED